MARFKIYWFLIIPILWTMEWKTKKNKKEVIEHDRPEKIPEEATTYI